MSANLTADEAGQMARDTLLRIAECIEENNTDLATRIFETLASVGKTSPDDAALLLCSLAEAGVELLLFMKYGGDPDLDIPQAA